MENYHLSDTRIILGDLENAPSINTIILLTKKTIYNSMKKEQKPNIISVKNVKNFYFQEKYRQYIRAAARVNYLTTSMYYCLISTQKNNIYSYILLHCILIPILNIENIFSYPVLTCQRKKKSDLNKKKRYHHHHYYNYLHDHYRHKYIIIISLYFASFSFSSS